MGPGGAHTPPALAIADVEAWQRFQDAMKTIGVVEGRLVRAVVLWDESPSAAAIRRHSRRSPFVILGAGLDRLARHYGFGGRR